MSTALQALAEITPEMEAGKACELMGVKLEDVLAELQFRQRQKGELMKRRMAAAQRAGGVRRIMREGEQDAHVSMMIDPVSYHYWGQRLGYEIWDNKTWCREYLRDNPESRIRQGNIRSHGVNGFKGLIAGKPTTREDRLALKTG